MNDSRNNLSYFKLILALVNKKEKKYSLKKFLATSVKPTEDNKKIIYSEIYIISETKILEEFSTNKIYFRSEFSQVVEYLLINKKSCVVMTKDGVGIIINSNFISKELEMFDIVMTDNVSNINCYLYNDELKKVTEIVKNINLRNNTSLNYTKKK